MLYEAAEEGRNLVVVSDDAYFGLFYGDDLLKESLFARLAGLHQRILAVKVDGPTKEEYVWGFRTGMLTFAARAFFSSDALYQALEKKAAGAIRSAISNCSHLSQSVLVKAMARDEIVVERQEKKKHSRSCGRKRVREILSRPRIRQAIGSPIPSTPAISCA